jgi:AbrB family transcriptional regulator (stage V sporulation protein T)
MKATGIVRRIDDLGRVVIPKEIRRTMRIREGDPLEIYTSSDGEVIFKKYSVVSEMADNAAQVAEVMTKLANCPTVVFDRDHVVAVAGVQKKEFSERRVSQALEEYIENRKNYLYKSQSDTKVYPVEGIDRPAIACSPILANGDVTGAVAFLAPDEKSVVNDVQLGLIQAASQFLGKQLED